MCGDEIGDQIALYTGDGDRSFRVQNAQRRREFMAEKLATLFALARLLSELGRQPGRLWSFRGWLAAELLLTFLGAFGF